MATSLKRSKGTASSTQIGTFSFWIKLCNQGNNLVMYSNTVENDNNRGYIQLTTDGKWRMVDNDTSGDNVVLRTNRRFRDFNGFYHFVIRIDTTQSTNTDRVRLYVNGVQETSFDETTYPPQNDNLKIFEGGQTDREYINRVYGGSAYDDTFILSHFHYADGQSYGPDTFGSTDSTTGEWKINTSPTVTYGNQGFFMFKDDASLSDDSGNSNDFSSDSGTVQKTEDCPSNVFCTLNSKDQAQVGTKPTLAYSNTQWTASGNSTSNCSIRGTLGNSSGKFYFEAKLLEASNAGFGMHRINEGNWYDSTGYMGNNGGMNGILFTGTDNIRSIVNGTNNGSSLGTVSNNDIIGAAFDLDNKKFYFHKNGTYISIGGSVGDPTSGSTGTGAFGTLGDGLNSSIALYVPAVYNESYGTASNIAFNFGNGYFGGTAISSEGTNASGNGKFEYDVPTGYTALSTKGLNL